MAFIKLEIEVPGWTVDELRSMVSTLDAMDSGNGNEIDPGNVRGLDVLTAILTGDMNLPMVTHHDEITG